jgi:hypothetical protein
VGDLLAPRVTRKRLGRAGTHDNPTTRGWYEDLPDSERQNLGRYLERAGGTSADAAPALLQLGWSSPAALAIAPLQDVLNLGKEARMNRPGGGAPDRRRVRPARPDPRALARPARRGDRGARPDAVGGRRAGPGSGLGDWRGWGALLGSRLQALAPHAEIVRHARLQNAVGYFRYGQRLRDELGAAPHRVPA